MNAKPLRLPLYGDLQKAERSTETLDKNLAKFFANAKLKRQMDQNTKLVLCKFCAWV